MKITGATCIDSTTDVDKLATDKQMSCIRELARILGLTREELTEYLFCAHGRFVGSKPSKDQATLGIDCLRGLQFIALMRGEIDDARGLSGERFERLLIHRPDLTKAESTSEDEVGY